MRVDNELVGKVVTDISIREGKIIITFDGGEVYHYGRREGLFTPGDELDEFNKLARSKWNNGRLEYKEKGSPVYEADTVQEAQNELLDLSNFMAVLYWELETIREKFDIIPMKREEEEL